MKKMITWRDASTADPTEWVYQDGTGFLISKKDAALKHTDYTYYASGKMASRTWARGVSTAYSYSSYGDLTGIDYSDATPDVSLTGLDRLGRATSVTQVGIGSETLSYQDGKGMLNARFYTSPGSVVSE